MNAPALQQRHALSRHELQRQVDADTAARELIRSSELNAQLHTDALLACVSVRPEAGTLTTLRLALATLAGLALWVVFGWLLAPAFARAFAVVLGVTL